MTVTHPTPLQGNEHIYNTTLPLKTATVLNFWRWAFSDLRMNNIRGIFGEWLVAVILEIPLTVRDSWQEWDLKTPDGVTIEIKTSAYLQAWEQQKISKIVFSGLRSRRLNLATNQYSERPTYNADLYVFCLQTEKDPAKWDALDLSQWRFYLLSREKLAHLNQDSISLSTLKRLSAEMTAEVFRSQAKTTIQKIAKQKLLENPTS